MTSVPGPQRRWRSIWVVISIVAVLTGGGVGIGFGLSPGNPVHLLRTVAPKTIAAKDIVSLEMFNSLRGVAVADDPTKMPCPGGPTYGGLCPAHHYLTDTTDGGVSWRVTGVLPNTVAVANLVDATMAFSSARVGYLYLDVNNEIIATTNAGATWTRLPVGGAPSAISRAGGVLWVIANFCASWQQNFPWTCPSRLVTYAAGQPHPLSDRTITPPPLSKSQSVDEASFVDRIGRADGIMVIGGANGASPSGLVLTDDDGRHWRTLANPCVDGPDIAAVSTPTPQRWYVYCQSDGGMLKGSTALYVSATQGRNWTLIGEANEEASIVGDIGPAMATTFQSSGNGTVLWRLLDTSWIAVSTDGGSNWTELSQPWGDQIVAVGATEAYDVATGIGLYRTMDGYSWSPVP